MSNKPPQAPVETVEPAMILSLDEFCVRLSKTSRRVELISGFHAFAKREGTLQATEVQFMDEFDKYSNRPVK